MSGRKWLLVGATVLLLVLMGLGAVAQDNPVVEESAEFNGTAVERAAVERMNEVRTANGLAPLEFSRSLSNNGRAWSQTMAFDQEVYHADASDFSCLRGGENVQLTYWQATFEGHNGKTYFANSTELGIGIANSWLNSSGHRENVMRESFESTGVGVFMPNPDAEKPKVYATQRFCG